MPKTYFLNVLPPPLALSAVAGGVADYLHTCLPVWGIHVWYGGYAVGKW